MTEQNQPFGKDAVLILPELRFFSVKDPGKAKKENQLPILQPVSQKEELVHKLIDRINTL